MPARPVLQLPPTGPPVPRLPRTARRGAPVAGAVLPPMRHVRPHPRRVPQQVPPNRPRPRQLLRLRPRGTPLLRPAGRSGGVDGADQGGPTQLLPMRRRRSRRRRMRAGQKRRAASERRRRARLRLFQVRRSGTHREGVSGGCGKGCRQGCRGRWLGEVRAIRGRGRGSTAVEQRRRRGLGGGRWGRVRRRRARGWGMGGKRTWRKRASSATRWKREGRTRVGARVTPGVGARGMGARLTNNAAL